MPRTLSGSLKILAALLILEPSAIQTVQAIDDTVSTVSNPPVQPSDKTPPRSVVHPSNQRLNLLSPSVGTLWEVANQAEQAEQAARARLEEIQNSPLPVRLPAGSLPGFSLPGLSTGAPLIASSAAKHRGPFGAISSWLEKLEKLTGSSIKASGHSTFTFQENSISGGSGANQAYQDNTYLGRGSGGVYNDTDIDVDATIFHAFHYRTHISNYLYGNPDQNKLQISYNTKSMKLEAGDINAGIHGNSLIDFTRYLSGIETSNIWTPHWKTTALISHSKASPHTLVIQGNNSAGPYFVYTGQIVPGSIQIRIDNRPMQQGTDYTLDTFTGELQFLNGNIVPATSTIAVTYETLDYGQSSGSIYGIRADYMIKGENKVGLTYITQQSQGSGSISVQTQQFYGNSSPLTPYVLDNPVDTTKPISVKVNGVPQVQGVDFVVDPSYLNQIRLTQGVLPTELVTIQYTPYNPSPNPGNRNVMGLDGTFGLGKLGSATLETAFSGISLNGQGIGGQALQLRASLTPSRSFHTNLTIRDISPNFSAIATPGFNQNEKSVDISSDYTASKRLHFSFDIQRGVRPAYSAASIGSSLNVNTVGSNPFGQFSGTASYQFGRNGSLSLSHNDMSSSYAQGGNSSSSNDSLLLQDTFGAVGLQAGIIRNTSLSTAFYNLTGTTGNTLQANNSNSSALTEHVALNWAPRTWVHLNTDLSTSQINSSGSSITGNTSAQNAQAGATFLMKHGFQIKYDYSLSNTGNGSTSAANSTTTTSPTGVVAGGSTAARITMLSASFLGFPAWRDIIPPSSGGLSSSGALNTGLNTTGLLSGGYNGGLGSIGNYSGLLGNGAVNSYTGVTSLNGQSSSNRISFIYSPGQALNASLSFLASSSLGTYQYNSSRTDTSFNMGWNPHGPLQIVFSYDLQHTAYTGGLGGAKVSSFLLDATARLFRKLNIHLDAQLLNNQSALNINSLTTPGSTGSAGSLTNTSSNVLSFLMHLDYPVSQRQDLFFDISHSLTAGYQGNIQDSIRFGMDFIIARPFKFSLGWQITKLSNSDLSQSASNYNTSSLVAQLGLTF